MFRIVRTLGFVGAVIVTIAAARPALARQRPTPTVTPTPPPPPRTIVDLTGSTGTWPPASKQPAPTPLATPPSPASSPLDAPIAALLAAIGDGERLTRDTITPAGTPEDLLDLVTEYLYLANQMRDHMYLPDPGATTPLGTEVSAFVSRWRDFGPGIRAGAMRTSPITWTEWERVAMSFKKAECPLRANPPLVIVNEQTLTPAEWACVIDGYFKELSGIEARVNASLTTARTSLTGPLFAKTSGLTTWVDATLRANPQALRSEGARRELAWRLHDVWLVGSRLRLEELRRRRSAGTGSTIFRDFLDAAPSVNRPEHGSLWVLRIPAGQQIEVVAGSVRATARVIARPEPDPAKRVTGELHDVHYHLQILPALVDIDQADELRRFEESLEADLLADSAGDRPRETMRFRVGVQVKRDQLARDRLRAIDAKRRDLENRRRQLLEALASR